MLDEIDNLKLDLAQLARLVVNERTEDACLFVARLVRKYRNAAPDLAKQMESFLRNRPARTNASLRKGTQSTFYNQTPPTEEEGHRSLLKTFKDRPNSEPPLLSSDLREMLDQLIQERQQSKHLASRGLHPTKSAIFLGKPGVGKTLTARWLAAQLDVPFYVLDLTNVMSSLLGKTGNNLRAALDFAKRNPCVLLLDEIDAIAKRRNDDTDVGELKRLVTVILQEVDEWPASGLLLAATNHPELIDTALWRRFDLVIEFKLPEISAVKEAVERFLGPDHDLFERWIDILTFVFRGQSFSEIERTIQRFRRASALGMNSNFHLIEEFIKSSALELERKPKIELARLLNMHTNLSQHAISGFTGVSRDTIRKYMQSDPMLKKRHKK